MNLVVRFLKPKEGDDLPAFEGTLEEVFQISGRGYVLILKIKDPSVPLKIGQTLKNTDTEQEFMIRGIEMLNYGAGIKNKRHDIVGVLVDISDDQASELKGKLFIKE